MRPKAKHLQAVTVNNNTWEHVVDYNGTTPPPERAAGDGVFRQQENQLVIFGGSDLAAQKLSDIWVFDFDTSEWTEITPSAGTIKGRFGHTTVYSSSLDSMFVFGGWTVDNLPSNELYRFDFGR